MLVVWIGLSSSYRYLMKEDSMCDEHARGRDTCST